MASNGIFAMLLFVSLASIVMPTSAVNRFRSHHFRLSKLRKNICLRHPTLTCRIRPTTGNRASGIVTFAPFYTVYNQHRARCEVRITGRISNLSPGRHGFHIHEFGDIRSIDGTSTGGHFVHPRGKVIEHGAPEDSIRHWGDFGNLEANASGTARYDRVDAVITLSAILGRGLVIHELEDVGASVQPTGGSGPRQGNCVIGFANPDLERNALRHSAPCNNLYV